MFFKRIQLGLVHVAVAMTLVPINSTLNRVMIKEFAISAALVALLAALPYLFSPIQVAIGSYSDRHPILGLRRTPYILLGLLLCVMGVVISPQAAFLLNQNLWAGLGVGILTFGAWGMGYNLASVSYLSLASELSGEKGRGKTIAIMWFMMITSIIITAIALSQMVDPYTPQALVSAFWVVGLAALGLGLVGIAGLEKRSADANRGQREHTWGEMFAVIRQNRQAKMFFWYLTILLAAILGQDILLEPFGAEAFGMSVKATTRITSLWGTCVLVSLLLAGLLEGRVGKRRVAQWGAWGATAGFALVVLSGISASLGTFYLGVVMLGLGTGLSTVSNLSLMMDMTTAENVGLFIGAWGMANAASRLVGTVLGGVVRDVVTQVTANPITGYIMVFGIEAAMLVISLWMLRRIDVSAFHTNAGQPAILERAAIANEA
jgi:BCD family chlorophyll transporter-like MFS transporter